ncbi:MAG: DUF349 domain-containing protein [Flavobacteriales bacterium]|jgi:hypothetical protein|nr:DUF349 domain-containing protein [Flavobacteriales bacterium]
MITQDITTDNLTLNETEGQPQQSCQTTGEALSPSTPQEEQACQDVAPKNTQQEKKTVDYATLSLEELIASLQNMIDTDNMSNREAYAIREAFDAQEASQELKEEFAAVWEVFRGKREKYAAQMAVEQKANLEERLSLIDELKALIEKEENASIKEFHSIQIRWRKCGMVPREQSSVVWQTYQHHVERFFDYLKLNREFRDMEFQRNLEEKNKIILRAEELINEPSVKKAFDQLQMLHKIWKEETGPVSPEHRQEVWERFSVATRAIHERRHQHLKEQKKSLKNVLDAKMAICQKIEDMAASGANSHDAWQKKMAEVEALKEEFKKVGLVAENKNAQVWERFKEVNRAFNQAKNNYYKDLKRSQMSNLEQKQQIVVEAEALKTSEDWNATADALKALQTKWKEIGHVPRQKSDELWAQFRAACNYFFDRMAESRKTVDASLLANLKAKEELMARVEAFEIDEKDIDATLETLKGFSAAWREIGRTPRSGKDLDAKFNATLDGLFDRLKLGKQEVTMMRFKDKIETLVADGNKAKFYAEVDFVRRKIDEITHQVHQLKNNIQFFSNASADSPLVKEVNKKIEKEEATLAQWKEKLAYMRSIKLD